jgi:sugar phosphate isomerase/epimerase
MKYAICNETFTGWDHPKVCDLVASLGYTGLEIAPFTLASEITEVSSPRRVELRRQAETAGITIIGTHWLLAKTTGYYLTTPDAEVRKSTGRYLCELVEATAEMGGNLMVLGSPLQRNLLPGVSPDQADDYALDTLSYCFTALERTGVRLCLEPLGPAETNYLNRAAHAVSLIQKWNHPNIKLHLDVKAMSSEAKSIPEIIRENREYTFHFHANDPNKRGPGFGETDFRPIFQALNDTGYAGWVSVEVFDYSPDPETIARESIRYMKECL